MSDTKYIRTQFKIYFELEIKSFLVILLIFVFTALTDIIVQIYLEDILKLSGIEIVNLPESSMNTVFESVWGDFLTTGSIIAIYYGSTAFSSDISNDKAIYFYLSRSISKNSYYLIRSIVKLLVILSVVVISSVLTYFLSLLFFNNISFLKILCGAILIAFALMSLLSITLWINSKYSTTASMGISALVLVLISVLQILGDFISWLKWFSPFSLASIWRNILNSQDFSGFLTNSSVMLAWIILPLLIGKRIFGSRDI